MKGTIKIKATGRHIIISGHLKEAGIMEQTALVDALMNTFDMRGDTRNEVCEMLLYIDAKRAEKENQNES